METFRSWRISHSKRFKSRVQKSIRDRNTTLINGVFTFSEKLKNDYDNKKITKEEFLKSGIDLVNDISKKMNSEVLYLSLHLDEKTPHFHFHLKNFDSEGKSIFFKNRDRENLSNLQNLGEKHFKKYGIKRGIKKEVSQINNVSLKKYWEKEITTQKNKFEEIINQQKTEIENLKDLRKETTKTDKENKEKKEIYNQISQRQNELRECNKKLKTNIRNLKKDTLKDTEDILKNIPYVGKGGEDLKKFIKQKLYKNHRKEISTINTQNNELLNYKKETTQLKENINQRETELNQTKETIKNQSNTIMELEKSLNIIKNNINTIEEETNFNYIKELENIKGKEEIKIINKNKKDIEFKDFKKSLSNKVNRNNYPNL
jgi:chromosome segregation ATPase